MQSNDGAERIAQIVAAAAKMTADQRARFLEVQCGSDQALRARVEIMFMARDDAAAFPRSVADAAARSAAEPVTRDVDPDAPHRNDPAAILGTSIGRYRLLQCLGEGGMGVVYMAEQREPVRRFVALKVIRAGMDSHKVIARFEAERQALAMMDHPNIARVLDAGETDTGRPYFVMELVRGIPITDYCDQAQLDARSRLSLFRLVCLAVQHAHQKGVIHRDIKPSNVLVTLLDAEAVPKVIDFGIAKAVHARLTDNPVFTEIHQLIGTPEYMSPEQAEMSALDIDTRSDIYSLGVLLYELLTGTTPLESRRLRSAPLSELQRMIREEEAPRPSTRVATLGARLDAIARQRRVAGSRFSSTLRGELDWIVGKALEKDRNRRYDTAAALAADVARHLAGEVVEASPPSALYRASKFVMRNRTAVIAGALVAAAVIAGTIATAFSMLTAMREAEHSAGMGAYLEEVFTSVEPVQARISERSLAEDAARGAALFGPDHPVVASVQLARAATLRASGLFEQAAVVVEDVIRSREVDGAVASPRQLGGAHLLLALIRADQGHHAEAVREAIRAIDLLRAASDGPSNAVAVAYLELAGIHAAADRHDDEFSSCCDAVGELRARKNGERDPQTVVAESRAAVALLDANQPSHALLASAPGTHSNPKIRFLDETARRVIEYLGPGDRGRFEALRARAQQWHTVALRDHDTETAGTALGHLTALAVESQSCFGPDNPRHLRNLEDIVMKLIGLRSKLGARAVDAAKPISDELIQRVTIDSQQDGAALEAGLQLQYLVAHWTEKYADAADALDRKAAALAGRAGPLSAVTVDATIHAAGYRREQLPESPEDLNAAYRILTSMLASLEGAKPPSDTTMLKLAVRREIVLNRRAADDESAAATQGRALTKFAADSFGATSETCVREVISFTDWLQTRRDDHAAEAELQRTCDAFRHEESSETTPASPVLTIGCLRRLFALVSEREAQPANDARDLLLRLCDARKSIASEDPARYINEMAKAIDWLLERRFAGEAAQLAGGSLEPLQSRGVLISRHQQATIDVLLADALVALDRLPDAERIAGAVRSMEGSEGGSSTATYRLQMVLGSLDVRRQSFDRALGSLRSVQRSLERGAHDDESLDAERRRLARGMFELYTAWHVSDPTRGYDERAAFWKGPM